jgi:ABC-2 type transport system permease protein
MHTLRLIGITWWFQIKQSTKAGIFVFTAIIEPLIFATLAYYLFKAGRQPGTLLYAALSAGLMGIWSATLFGAGGAINYQRWQGVLEPLIAAPTPYFLVVFPQTLAASTIGVYSLTSTLLWGRIVFGIPLHFAHPLTFLVAVAVTILALGLLGLVIAASFILYREAPALSNMLEFPVWILTGVIVPLSLLPGWVHYLSWGVAPTWGYRSIRAGALGGDAWPAIGWTLVLAAAYVVIGKRVLQVFERRAREKATLSLV